MNHDRHTDLQVSGGPRFAPSSVPHSESVPPGRSLTSWGPSKDRSGWLVTLVTSSHFPGLCSLHTSCGCDAATRELPCGALPSPRAWDVRLVPPCCGGGGHRGAGEGQG